MVRLDVDRAHRRWRRSAPSLPERCSLSPCCRLRVRRHSGLDLAEPALELRNRAAPRFRRGTEGPAVHGHLPWRRSRIADGMVGEQRKDALARLGESRPRADFFPSSCREMSGALPCLFLSWPDYSPIAFTTSRRSFRFCKPRRIRSWCNRFFLPSCTRWKKICRERSPWSRMKPDATGEETQRNDAASNSEDLWKSRRQKGPAADEQKNAADAAGRSAAGPDAGARQIRKAIPPAKPASRTAIRNRKKARMETKTRTANRSSNPSSRGRRAGSRWGSL